MKTILIPTDFSENSAHVAEYGYKFARQIQSNIILCNAFIVPVEVPQGSMIAWPIYELDEIIESCENDVNKLKKKLEQQHLTGFQPSIICSNEAGALQDVVSELVAKHDIGTVIIGTHGGNGLSGFILGNHSRRMIDNTTKPLMLIPPGTKYSPVKKIAFATDMENMSDDLDAIFELINYARYFNAEILLTYVDNKSYHTDKFKKDMQELLTSLSNKANYPLIYYRLVKSRSTESGLDWLCEHGQVDVLAMVHRPHNFLDAIISGSHTQKMANHITIPLLVFPSNK